MKLSLIFLIVIGCVIAAAEECTKEEIKEYRKWQRKYNKPHYRDSEEQQRRCQILNQRREDIKSSDSDRRMHRSGLNEYSDLTEQEMHDTRYGYVAPSDDEPTEPVRDDKNKYPPSKDWRDDGIITAIKNQGMIILIFCNLINLYLMFSRSMW